MASKKKNLDKVKEVFQAYGADPGRQVKELKKLLKEAQESGDIHYIGVVYQMLAATYKNLGNNKNLFTSGIKALTFLKHTDDYRMIANAYTALGVAYFDQENYQLALANYDKAFEIIRRHRIKGISKLIVMNDLATVYSAMGDYKTGVFYLKECLEQTKRESPENAPELVAFTLNLADSYMCDHCFAEAAAALEEGKGWVGQVGFKTYVCAYYEKYARAEYELGHKRQGNSYLDKALKLAGEISDSYWVFDDFGVIAHLLLKKGDIKRAGKVVDLIEGYCGRNTATMDKLLLNSVMADYYKTIGEHEKAVTYYEQLEEQYKARTTELKQIQLNIHKSMKEADSSINRLNKLIAESENRARRDPMTGLLNHSAMIRVGGEFIETASKKKEKIGAIFIDIDLFKECNDTYGHARGDEIIKEVALVCRSEETDNIQFARYGGDEFLGMTIGLDDKDVAAVARRICKKMRDKNIPNQKNPHGHRLTLSVGVVNVAVTNRTDTIIQVANYADKAVYHAKKAGKNCIYMLEYDHAQGEDWEASYVKVKF
ncbi:MAG: GGDEF domain-containing protein [Lachnospiraceae bacterium]|nr:GGDEF domain-containing protein [Lachnospiraceae bacterium]